MPDTPLASPVDLANMPGLDITQYTTHQVDLALRQATSDVIAVLGWDPREGERTYKLRAHPYGVPFWLPAQNVTAVDVVVDDEDLDVLSTWWDEWGRVDLDRAVSTSGLVTYTAGWFPGSGTLPSEIPQAIQDACLAIAVQWLRDPVRLRSWTAGQASETYADDSYDPRQDPRLDAYRVVVLA